MRDDSEGRWGEAMAAAPLTLTPLGCGVQRCTAADAGGGRRVEGDWSV